MVTTLYLIRHGQTVGGEEKRYKGHTDVPLSERGAEQMEGVSAYIVQAGSALTAVYCSDLSRSVKSAGIVARPHSLRPILIPSLRERNFGAWEGMSFEEVQKRYPEEFKAWIENPLAFSPVRGESTVEVKKRVIKAFHEILENHKGEHIAIVAHGGTNRVILCHVTGIPLENIFRIEQDYGALNIIEFWDTYPVVKLVNFTAYVLNQ
jgi:alpha-ribazole phosphatase/probable phosphoglycerate mutase